MKLDVRNIIGGHLKERSEFGGYDKLFFYAMPLFLGACGVLFGELNDTFLRVSIIFLSIFGGFLFNLNVFIFSKMKEIIESHTDQQNIRRIVIKQIFYNINFTLILILFTICIILIFTLLPCNVYAENTLSYFILVFLVLVVLHILLVLKKFVKLIEQLF